MPLIDFATVPLQHPKLGCIPEQGVQIRSILLKLALHG